MRSEAAALAASGASPQSPPVATLGGGVHSPVPTGGGSGGSGYEDDDDGVPPSPPGFNNTASPLPPRPDYRPPLGEFGRAGGADGGRDFHYPDDDMDEDEQMMDRAIQESMGIASGGRRGASNVAGAMDAPITIDDDENDDLQRAIQASVGVAGDGGGGVGSGFDAAAAIGIRRGRTGSGVAAEHERDNRPPPARTADLIFGGTHPRGGSSAGDPPRGQMFGTFGAGAGAGGGGVGGAVEHDVVELPDGIDREEARMLEAAMLGIPYEPPEGRVVGGSAGAGGLGVNGVGINGFNGGVAASAEATEARMMRDEQDWAYEESLRMDRAKEAAAVAKREEEERAAAEAAAVAAVEAEAAAVAAEERSKAIAAAANALPDEPKAGEEGVVDVAIRLPDGRRVRRRFAKTDPLQAIFSFLVSAEHLEAGTYRLVAQFPRRSFENKAEGAPTLQDAGLTQKQEALFVEMTGDTA